MIKIKQPLKLCVAYPNSSYSETFIRNHLKYLNPDYSIFHGWAPYINEMGESIFNFPYNNDLVRGAVKNTLPKFYKKKYNSSLTSYLKKNKINALLAEYGPTGISVMEACESANVNLIIHFHGFDAYHFDTIKKYAKEYKLMFSKSKAIVSVSKDMQNQLIEIGAPPNKLHCNPYGVDIVNFSNKGANNSLPLLISVGRFTAKKAPNLVLKAFALALNGCKARLIMIGDGEEFENAKNLAKELKIESNVDFLGVKKPEEIQTELKKARAFIQHSRRAENGDSEGTPNSVLEASASGLPIISTKHAGIRDAVIHNETGFLVEEGDFVGMSKYIIELINKPDLASKMGLKAREHMIDNYNLPDQIEKLKKLIESTI